jgi:hypothetical protein
MQQHDAWWAMQRRQHAPFGCASIAPSKEILENVLEAWRCTVMSHGQAG